MPDPKDSLGRACLAFPRPFLLCPCQGHPFGESIFTLPETIFTLPESMFSLPETMFGLPETIFTLPESIFTLPETIFTIPAPCQRHPFGEGIPSGRACLLFLKSCLFFPRPFLLCPIQRIPWEEHIYLSRPMPKGLLRSGKGIFYIFINQNF